MASLATDVQSPVLELLHAATSLDEQTDDDIGSWTDDDEYMIQPAMPLLGHSDFDAVNGSKIKRTYDPKVLPHAAYTEWIEDAVSRGSGRLQSTRQYHNCTPFPSRSISAGQRVVSQSRLELLTLRNGVPLPAEAGGRIASSHIEATPTSRSASSTGDKSDQHESPKLKDRILSWCNGVQPTIPAIDKQLYWMQGAMLSC